jgi:hypothetical protein
MSTVQPINTKYETINTNSVLLTLEELTMEYNNLLTQYQQAITDYNTFLQQYTPDASSNSISDSSYNKLVYTNSQAFWGASVLTQSTANSVTDCMASCSQTSGCSGATYDASSNICYLTSGNGEPVPSSSNQYAIVPSLTLLMNNIQNISEQLDLINSQIQEAIDQGQEYYNTQEPQRLSQASSLIEKYNELISEREAIAANMKTYNTLDEKYNIGNISVTQNYYTFWLLIFLAGLFVFILIRFTMSGSKSNSGSGLGSFTYSQPNIQYGGDLNFNAYYIIIFIVIIMLMILFKQFY